MRLPGQMARYVPQNPPVHAPTHSLPPTHAHPTQSVLYLATDQGADKALEPDGFATLQGSAGTSGAQALKHIPIDVKVCCRRVGGGVGKIRIERTIDPSNHPRKTEPLLRAR